MNQVLVVLAFALFALLGAGAVSALYADRCESAEPFNRRGVVYVCKRVLP